MSNIDKREIHNQQLKAFITGFLGDPAHDNQSSHSLTAEVFRIALASLEAEPVAYIRDGFRADGVHFCGGIISAEEHERTKPALSERYNWKHQPLFVAPPEPVSVPDEDLLHMAASAIEDLLSNKNRSGAGVWADIPAKLRRAAMLQGVENAESPTTIQTARVLNSSPKIAESPSGNSPVIPDCSCSTCRPVTFTDSRFVVCSECGNKRCPHANDHRNAYTGSNEPSQEGSSYPAAPQQEAE